MRAAPGCIRACVSDRHSSRGIFFPFTTVGLFFNKPFLLLEVCGESESVKKISTVFFCNNSCDQMYVYIYTYYYDDNSGQGCEIFKEIMSSYSISIEIIVLHWEKRVYQ